MSKQAQSLAEKRVWVTRPRDQATAWQSLLLAQGCAVDEVPLLEIKPLQSDADRQRIKSRILDLDLYQTVLFVSQNAVQYFFDVCEDYWPQLPAKLVFAGVGVKTTSLLKQRIHAVDPAAHITVVENNSPMDSESLLAQDFLQHVQQTRILICRGLGGRPKLADELNRRGAQVDLCELYERALPDAALEACQLALQQRPDAIPVFSGESLANLELLLEKSVASQRLAAEALVNLKSQTHVVVPSKRVAALASDSGWLNVSCAVNATDEEMLNAVCLALQTPGP